MTKKQFQIFIPNKWSWLELNMRLLILFLIFCGICIISDMCLPNTTLTDVLQFLFLLVFVSLLIFVVFGARFREPLHGKIQGVLELKVDEICVNSKSIPISTIKKISFDFIDYWDMQLSVWGRLLNARKSQGVNNNCEIETYHGEMIRLRFRRMYSLEQNNCKYEFFEYYLSGKLAFIELTRMMDCSNYDAIKSLKREIEEYKNRKISADIVNQQMFQ